MIDSKKLASSLLAAAGVSADKRANAFTSPEDQPVNNVKLQEIVGDPDTYPLSWSNQNTPATGNTPTANPLSPVQGDEAFFAGLFDGARFQANDGSWWDIESYDFEGQVTIRNVWYPRTEAVVSVQDVRRSIHSWIEPFLQRVPPLPIGVDYGAIEVKQV
jgi:hypothetical protein